MYQVLKSQQASLSSSSQALKTKWLVLTVPNLLYHVPLGLLRIMFSVRLSIPMYQRQITATFGNICVTCNFQRYYRLLQACLTLWNCLKVGCKPNQISTFARNSIGGVPTTRNVKSNENFKNLLKTTFRKLSQLTILFKQHVRLRKTLLNCLHVFAQDVTRLGSIFLYIKWIKFKP